MVNYTFGILPTIMRHDGRVSDFACRLYSEVDSLSNKFGYCFATNAALAKNLQKSPSQISRTLSELEGLGYVSLVVEGGYKRKIYPKRDFRDMEGVDEIAAGGTQFCVGGKAFLQRGVRKNSMTANKIINQEKHIKIIEEPKIENDILATVHDQVDETAVKVVEVIPSKAKSPKYIYPPMQDELIPLFYDKLIAKKRDHPQIIDCWNWANMEAEKFFLHWERKNWQIQKLGNAIATWVNGSITFGTVTKPCPIQYKGNPANAQSAQPTKVHVEERPALTQHDIEYSQAAFASVEQMFKQMGA